MSELTHLQRIRQEMPATTAHLYFNTGTFGPLPTCVVETMNERLQIEWREGRIGPAGYDAMKAIFSEARSRVARLLNADADEIALTANTGEGMNIITYGFNWREGDEVITTNHEHVNAFGPLYQIRERYGVAIRFADVGPLGERPIIDAVADLMTPRTRLISLSHVLWTTGAVLNISELGQMAREVGIPVLIDGAQSAGAILVDVKALGVDFYAIPMQKWLCGPDGIGALYVRQEAMNYVEPTYVGAFCRKPTDDEAKWELHENAKRFEGVTHQTTAWAGQVAALKWLEEAVGYQWLFERISSLHAYAYHVLETIPGLTILTPEPGVSGLLAFTLEDRDTKEVVKQLRDQHNISIRDIPSRKSLRVSTGFYNTEEEIDTLVQALQYLRAA